MIKLESNKIYLLFTIFSIVAVYFLGMYLKIQTNMLDKKIINIKNDIKIAKMEQMAKNKSQLHYEINLDITNKQYIDSVKNALLTLFDLIPDQITITQMLLTEDRLILKGITPTMEIYSFLLQAPLKSIFATSRVNFFPLQNGWYNFISINTLKEES